MKPRARARRVAQLEAEVDSLRRTVNGLTEALTRTFEAAAMPAPPQLQRKRPERPERHLRAVN